MTANYVPAAAVIRRSQALTGIIGRKGSVAGKESLMLKHGAQHRDRIGNFLSRVIQRYVEFLE